MALEQVVPVVPQGTFSVTARKLSWVLPFPPQWSCGQRRAARWGEHAPGDARAGLGGGELGGSVPGAACLFAVPAEAAAPPVQGEVVAIPIHRAGGQAELVGTLPRPTLTGAGGQCQSAHTSLLEAPAARPHGWPGCASSRCWAAPPRPVPGVAAHVDGLAWLGSWPRCAHRGRRTRGPWPPSPLATSPVGTHSPGLALGAVLWEDRPCLMDDLELQRGPRDSGGRHAVHVQGMAALLTGGPAGPGVRRCGSRHGEHGWGANWGGRGAQGACTATQALAASRRSFVQRFPSPALPAPGSGLWPPMQVSVPWVQELPGEHGQGASLPLPSSAGAPTKRAPSSCSDSRWGSRSLE